MFDVLIRLADGDRIAAGSFEDADEAAARAGKVADRFRTAGAWPRFGDRLIQPHAVISVDVVEERRQPWEGSPSRRVDDRS